MALEFGKELIMIHIWANGRIIKLGDMECINGRMVISMKANGKPQLRMVKELTSLQIKMSMQDFIKMVNLTDMDNTNGVRALFTSENSKLV